MSETRTRRTPSQILAEAEAKAAAARVKVARAAAKDSPQAKDIMDELTAVRKTMTADSKLLGDGPQSAAARIALKRQRILEIEAAAEQAQLRAEDLSDRKAALEASLETLIETMAEDMAHGTDEDEAEAEVASDAATA